MHWKTGWLPGIYLILCVVHLWSVLYGEDAVRFLTKPLLVSILAVYFFLQTRSHPSRIRNLIFTGLVFSIAGDTFLMFDRPQFFLIGLGCFLITQICYLSAFLSVRGLRQGSLARHPWLVIPLLVYFIGISAFLWPDLSPFFRWPVLLYSVVITSMAMGCLNLWGEIPGPVFRRLFSGVILFLISDSLIALSRFKGDEIDLFYPSLLIMSTYLIAQYFITKAGIDLIRYRDSGTTIPMRSS